MTSNITLRMLKEIIKTLPPSNLVAEVKTEVAPADLVMKNLTGMPTPETLDEIARLHKALAVLSPDVGRGHGSFYDSTGHPVDDYWLAVIWAIRGLRWQSGKAIAQRWSQQAQERYTEDGFEQAWNGYDPLHPNPVGIGSLYKRTEELAHSSGAPLAGNPSKYTLIGSQQLQALPPLSWVIKGVLPSTGVAAIYGPSASGKSFLALDMATAIARGTPWFGHRTKMASVVYVALEGEAGYRNRVRAWEIANGASLSQTMSFLMQPFRLNDPQDVASLALVSQRGSVIFIDTMNRAAPTSDENSSRDMGEILEGIKALQAAIGGLVVLIHHTGKDPGKGARGHSSFFAALDGAVAVDRNAAGRSWSVAKAKDGEDGQNHPFRLQRHVLGLDAEGDEITSCTVESDVGCVFRQAEPKGAAQKAALRAMKTAIRASTDFGRAGSGSSSHCLRVVDGIGKITATLTTCAANKRNNRAQRLLDDLVRAGFLASGLEGDEGWVWLPA